jgi:hypothetical protein
MDSSHKDPITGAWYGCYAMTGKNWHSFRIFGTDSAYAMDFDIPLPNDTLLTGTYRFDTYDPAIVNGSFVVNGYWYVLNTSLESMTIDILRYSNGTIDATFSGKIGYTAGSMRVITDGRMSNVKVIYW